MSKQDGRGRKGKLENQIFPNLDKLCQAMTVKIKMFVINSPNNAAGVMISREILSDIARLAMVKDCQCCPMKFMNLQM